MDDSKAENKTANESKSIYDENTLSPPSQDREILVEDMNEQFMGNANDEDDFSINISDFVNQMELLNVDRPLSTQERIDVVSYDYSGSSQHTLDELDELDVYYR